MVVAKRSMKDPRKVPASPPSTQPMMKPISEATSASISVFEIALDRSDQTLRPVASERPRSPCTTFSSQMPNCTGSGLSSP